MPDSKLCIAQIDSPYIIIDFIAYKPWVYKMKAACPTHFPACLLL